LARQCLNSRIPTREILERDVLKLVKERSDKKINGSFSITDARKKRNRLYNKVNTEN
jgi:hypothetical protein